MLLRCRCCCVPPLPTSPLPLLAEPRRDAQGCGEPFPRCAPGPAAHRQLPGKGARGWRGEGAQLRPVVPRVPGGCCGVTALGMVMDGAGCPGAGTAVRQEEWARVTGRELRWHRASSCAPWGAETERVVLGARGEACARGQPWSGQKDCSHRGSNEGAVMGQQLAWRGQEGLRCLWIGWVPRCSSAARSNALGDRLSAPLASPATPAPPPSAPFPCPQTEAWRTRSPSCCNPAV